MLLILKRQAEGEEGSEHGSDAAADQSKQPELWGWNTSDIHFVPYHSAILNGCSRLRYHVVVMIATSEFVRNGRARACEKNILNKGMLTATGCLVSVS